MYRLRSHVPDGWIKKRHKRFAFGKIFIGVFRGGNDEVF